MSFLSARREFSNRRAWLFVLLLLAVLLTVGLSTLALSETPTVPDRPAVTSKDAASSDAPAPKKTPPKAAVRSPSSKPEEKDPHPLDPALRIAYDGLEHIRADIVDYTSMMRKRERVDGELIEQKIFAKVRTQQMDGDKVKVPFSVYVKVLEPKSIAGREAIYVEGRDNDKIVAHGTGLQGLFRVYLKPRGYWAMMDTRYPITDIGLNTMVEKLIERGERDRKRGECEVEFHKGKMVGDRVCTQIIVRHPVQRDYFDFHIAEIFIDDERTVPLRYSASKWPAKKGGEPILDEEVVYTDLKLNVGLTDKDFDPDNKEYDFP